MNNEVASPYYISGLALWAMCVLVVLLMATYAGAIGAVVGISGALCGILTCKYIKARGRHPRRRVR